MIFFLRKGPMQCIVSINSVSNTLSLFSTAAIKFGINFTLVVWHFKRLQVFVDLLREIEIQARIEHKQTV